MQKFKRRILGMALAALLVGELSLAPPSYSAVVHEGFNDEYVFATTKSVDRMDVNPALKITLMPVTIVLDTVFLPFAVIAGFFT